MSNHHPAGLVLAVALAICALTLLYVAGSGCYRCKTPDCSELPPGPSPWVETVTKDASYER